MPCSKGHVKRLFGQGAIEIDGLRVGLDHAYMVVREDQLPSHHTMRVGKHRFINLTVDPPEDE